MIEINKDGIYAGEPTEALRRIRRIQYMNKDAKEINEEIRKARQKEDWELWEKIAEEMPKFEKTEENLQILSKLNTKLTEIEKKINKEIKAQKELAEAKIEDIDFLVDNYEIEVTLNFYLGKSDAYYYSDKSNLIVSLYEKVNKETPYFTDENIYHNKYDWKSDERHCWSFFSLYTNTQLSLNELLRIKEIGISVKVDLQYNLNLGE